MSQEKLAQQLTTTCANCQTQMKRSPPNTCSSAASPGPAETTNVNSADATNGLSSEDENEETIDEVVEESNDGRWSKRNECVSQRDVPGIDNAYLAMDTEYGFEVVWNEINLTGGKKFKNQNLHDDENEIDNVFKNLINLNHSNIVKFHDYWIDRRDNKDPRIIFITEYMSSGSLKQFLRKTKRTNQSIKKSTWKRWCIQLLTALDYMHKCEPPVVHGDLSCDTIYIQHNGLIKIGSIAPDIVNTHVKTCIDLTKWSKHMHYIAPELKEFFGSPNDNQEIQTNSPSVDIYAFGMVALEMFNLEFGGNGSTHTVTPELIKQLIDSLDERQQDFIKKCIEPDPKKRPSAKELLFHPLLFEVPSLRLFSAHQLMKNYNESIATFNNSSFSKSSDSVIATLKENEYKFGQLPPFDVNKYLEDVKNGVNPLIVVQPNPSEPKIQVNCESTWSVKSAVSPNSHRSSNVSSKTSSSNSSPLPSMTNDQFEKLVPEQTRTQSPSILVQSQNGASSNQTNCQSISTEQTSELAGEADKKHSERRQAQQIDTNLTLDETQNIYKLSVTITFEDRTARLIQSALSKTDTVNDLADELIDHGLVNELDKETLCSRLSQALNKYEYIEGENVYTSHQNQIL